MKITILNYSVIIGSLENSLDIVTTQALQNIGLKSIKVSSINLNYVLGVLLMTLQQWYIEFRVLLSYI